VRRQVRTQVGKNLRKKAVFLFSDSHLKQTQTWQNKGMYDAPHPFEPLLPGYTRLEGLMGKAHDLALAATGLASIQVPPELRHLLRSMNSYYTNRIEGQHTRPHEIEQALRKDFSSDAKLAARQRLALAHCSALQPPSRAATAPGTVRQTARL
jgi:hypothetical protein